MARCLYIKQRAIHLKVISSLCYGYELLLHMLSLHFNVSKVPHGSLHLNIFCIFLAKSDSPESDKFFMLWIWAAIVSTCYTLTWDIKMDWGLLDTSAPKDNRFLREQTVYRYKVN